MWTLNPVRKMLQKLRLKGTVLVTAESLTGGMIGASITSIPGASDAYWGGFIVYSNEAKVRLLGVDPGRIEIHGPVSEETAEAMAVGALSVSAAGISVAVTGLAGPGRASGSIPVGTVWIACAERVSSSHSSVKSVCLHLSGSRARIRRATVRAAFKMVLTHLDRQ